MPANSTPWSAISLLRRSPAERRALLQALSPEDGRKLYYHWPAWARPQQLPPAPHTGATYERRDGGGGWRTLEPHEVEAWRVWVCRCGRGWGKTRTGASWVHARALQRPKRWIALVAKTPADARDIMVDGPGGLLDNAHPDERPTYEPSKRRLTWKNGSWATVFSDAEPDQLRGFSGDTAWLDELAKYRHPEVTWSNLEFGMRESSEDDKPRCLITTTPRELPILKQIESMAGTVVVRGSSYENRANLAPSWFTEVLSRYEGTSLGRQEIYAEDIGEAQGALWRRAWFDRHRVERAPSLQRIVVAIDPPGSAVTGTAGIVGTALGADARGYALADESGHYTPDGWARAGINLYVRLAANLIVVERNHGGEMCENTLRATAKDMERDKLIPSAAAIKIETVWASHGKDARAEPVSALYEQGRMSHVGTFGELEDECCTWEPGHGMASPNRLDALVWGFTKLLVGSLGPMPAPQGFGGSEDARGKWGAIR